MWILASQLPFLANRNAELAVLQSFWPVNRTKLKGHVVLLSGPTVYSLYCGSATCKSLKLMEILGQEVLCMFNS